MSWNNWFWNSWLGRARILKYLGTNNYTPNIIAAIGMAMGGVFGYFLSKSFLPEWLAVPVGAAAGALGAMGGHKIGEAIVNGRIKYDLSLPDINVVRKEVRGFLVVEVNNLQIVDAKEIERKIEQDFTPNKGGRDQGERKGFSFSKEPIYKVEIHYGANVVFGEVEWDELQEGDKSKIKNIVVKKTLDGKEVEVSGDEKVKVLATLQKMPKFSLALLDDEEENSGLQMSANYFSYNLDVFENGTDITRAVVNFRDSVIRYSPLSRQKNNFF